MTSEQFTEKAQKRPCYTDLEDARQVLSGIGVDLTPRQMKRAAEADVEGKRKMPFFLDPIDGKLKINKDTLLQIYFDRQVAAESRAELDI